MLIFHWLNFCFLVFQFGKRKNSGLHMRPLSAMWFYQINITCASWLRLSSVTGPSGGVATSWGSLFDPREISYQNEIFLPEGDFSTWGSIFRLGFLEGMRDCLAVSAVALMKVSGYSVLVTGPYVPVLVTRSALIVHWYTYAPPRCRTSQYRRTFILLSVSLWNDLVDPVFDGVVLAGFKSRSNAFLLA